MPTLIKDGASVANPWVQLPRESTLEDSQAVPDAQILVPLSLWQEKAAQLRDTGKTVGVWLDSDERAEALSIDDLASLPLIALNFPVFTDGRSFSNAVTLRQRLGYQGELRAIGDVLRDQLFFMKRCGFDSFDLADGVNVEEALKAFGDFSETYAATVEEPRPLFLRRA